MPQKILRDLTACVEMSGLGEMIIPRIGWAVKLTIPESRNYLSSLLNKAVENVKELTVKLKRYDY